MSTPEALPDITLLMPGSAAEPENWERTILRYSGLIEALQAEGCEPAMVFGQAQFSDRGVFLEGIMPRSWATDGIMEEVDRIYEIPPTVVRDLTLPPDDDRRLYKEPDITLVHSPEFNAFLRDKSKVAKLLPDIQPASIAVSGLAEAKEAIHAMPGEKVVFKPVTGSQSKGIHIGEKAEVAETLSAQGTDYDAKPRYPAIVQEFIETEEGMPELNIKGRHNFRVLMIGGTAIFGFGRLAEEDDLLILDDSFEGLDFHAPEKFPVDLDESIEAVKGGLAELPDGLNTIVAADFMRGYVSTPEDSRVYLCELNRRPLRNSRYDDVRPGTLWAANQWDTHEAALLAAKKDAIIA